MNRYAAHLFDPATGTRFVHEWDEPEREHDCDYGAPFCPDVHEEYMWCDGNFSCDCNRLIFMGIEDERLCGNTVKLESLVNLTTGALLRMEEI